MTARRRTKPGEKASKYIARSVNSTKCSGRREKEGGRRRRRRRARARERKRELWQRLCTKKSSLKEGRHEPPARGRPSVKVVLELNVGASTFTFPSRLAITLQSYSTVLHRESFPEVGGVRCNRLSTVRFSLSVKVPLLHRPAVRSGFHPVRSGRPRLSYP